MSSVECTGSIVHVYVRFCLVAFLYSIPHSPHIPSGGLAFPDDAQVQRVAAQCLRVYDSNPDQPGHRHTQSRRFMDPHWEGLHPERGDQHQTDPPLRSVMEDLAVGEITMSELVAQHIKNPQESPTRHSFLRWVASFRLVSQTNLVDLFFFVYLLLSVYLLNYQLISSSFLLLFFVY